MKVKEGLPYLRGAHWDGDGTNFELFSANATKVRVCLFDWSGDKETARIELPEYTNEIFQGYLPDVQPGTFYSYRVHGPCEPRKPAIVSIQTNCCSTPRRRRRAPPAPFYERRAISLGRLGAPGHDLVGADIPRRTFDPLGCAPGVEL